MFFSCKILKLYFWIIRRRDIMNVLDEYDFFCLNEEYIRINILNIFISVFYFFFGVSGNLCVLLVYCLCVKW